MSGSWLISAIERFFESVIEAWQTSAVKSRLAAAVASSRSRGGHAVQLAGWAALGAAATHIGLVGIGQLMNPPMAGMGWIAAVPFAVACIWKPEAVVAAWRASRTRSAWLLPPSGAGRDAAAARTPCSRP